MTEISASQTPRWKLDKAWIAVLVLPVLIAVFDRQAAIDTLAFAGSAMIKTGAFIAFAVLAVGFLKATGAESLLAKAFEGREISMILWAALLGGLSPFCSCEVIPFIAALLAVGAPLSAVMAFWLSSPLMDPAMFLITAGTLGTDFAVFKTVSAVGLGLLGGATVYAFARTPVFTDPLKETATQSSCGCGPSAFDRSINWRFWTEGPRRLIFRETVLENALFLGKWLLLAYMIEALMLAYVPAELIAGFLGGDGFQPILLGALIGAPAYLNGYAAVPLIDALLAQGMAPGAAMAFVISGGVSCIPAAVAVWALVKPRVFVAYLSIAMIGSLIAGLAWSIFTI